MKFEESIHWPEGLFLHPHHLQQLQNAMESRDRTERSFHMAHPFGLIDFEFDRDALQSQRVVVKRLSAVMPSGTEISMPGNAQIPVLDLDDVLADHHEPFMVYLSLPRRSDYDGNLSEGSGTQEKRLFSLHETVINDENTGDNEVSIAKHRMNARLVSEFASLTDMEVIPVMRLVPIYKENMQPKLQLDSDYIPPFMLVSADCPLESMISELCIQIAKRSVKMLRDLTDMGCFGESLSVSALFSILQFQTLNRGKGRIQTLLASGNPTPFELYLELRVLLGELISLHPNREIQPIAEYNHLDYAPQFLDLIQQIRLMILEEGVSGFSKLSFTASENGRGLEVKLKEQHFLNADGWYLAITCDGEPREIVSAVENGDKFKMINPGGHDMRIRGVKLTELRYPPRFLPAIPNAFWFTMQIDESPIVWKNIHEELGVLLEWGNGLFPRLEATLFVTNLNKEKDA